MKKPATRKAHPVLTTALLLLFALASYFGTFYAHRAGGGPIIYVRGTNSTIAVPSRLNARFVSRYRFAQQASEIVFWPADKLDESLRPDRFGTGPEIWPELREEWWE